MSLVFWGIAVEGRLEYCPVDIPKILWHPVVSLLQCFLIGWDGCCFSKGIEDLLADYFVANDQMGLGGGDHGVSEGCTGHFCHCCVPFCSFITLNVQ